LKLEVLGRLVDDHHGSSQHLSAATIRDCKRDVALSPPDEKLAAFEAAAETLRVAVADRWLPKAIIADRLQEIADAHSLFGKSLEEIQRIIAGAIAKIDVPPLELPAKPPKRRLIAHRASDLEPEKLVRVWPGRIPEASLCCLEVRRASMD
jgi:putative DNA primase/helicase